MREGDMKCLENIVCILDRFLSPMFSSPPILSFHVHLLFEKLSVDLLSV